MQSYRALLIFYSAKIVAIELFSQLCSQLCSRLC